MLKYLCKFSETLKGYFDKGFRIAKAKVNFMVYRKDEEKQKEVIVVLQGLLLVR